MVRVQNDTILQLGVAIIFTMAFMLTFSIATPSCAMVSFCTRTMMPTW